MRIGWNHCVGFLRKDVLNEEFPRLNDVAGLEAREREASELWFGSAFGNIDKAAAVPVLTSARD